MTFNKILLIIYVIWILLVSIITLILYAKDKKMATKNSGPNRIKEKTLLSTTCLGGAFGAFIARILFRHKTNKIYFSIVIYLSLFLQAAGLGFLIAMAI